MNTLNAILKQHLKDRSDISYNYIIGEDGNIYEGRGTYKVSFEMSYGQTRSNFVGLYSLLSKSYW